MQHGRAEVPAVDSVRCPGLANGGFFVHEHACAWRTQWGAVEVERAVDLRMCRELWVDARASQQIQGDLGLGEKLVP